MKAIVMNLPSSTKRLEDFRRDYPKCLPEATVWPAKSGAEVTPPNWWKASANNYAIGVNFRDIVALENALAGKRRQTLLLFEDDVVFTEDFPKRYDAFLKAVSDDWDMLYLGGDHVGNLLPVQISETVLRCRCTWAPHAVVIRPSAFQAILDALDTATPWACEHRHECRLGELMRNRLKVYAPVNPLAGQRGGIPSDNAHFTRERDEYFLPYLYLDAQGVVYSYPPETEA